MWTYTHIGSEGAAMSTTTEQLGAAIRNARIEHNWTQVELAHQTGLSREWVCKVERGAPRLEFDKVLVVIQTLGFDIVDPSGCRLADALIGKTEGSRRRRVSPKSRTRHLEEVRKGQQLAGHDPEPDAMKRAERVLDGEITVEEARAELDARFRK
jgi:y4mF family transcriptional regulator